MPSSIKCIQVLSIFLGKGEEKPAWHYLNIKHVIIALLYLCAVLNLGQ